MLRACLLGPVIGLLLFIWRSPFSREFCDIRRCHPFCCSLLALAVSLGFVEEGAAGLDGDRRFHFRRGFGGGDDLCLRIMEQFDCILLELHYLWWQSVLALNG